MNSPPLSPYDYFSVSALPGIFILRCTLGDGRVLGRLTYELSTSPSLLRVGGANYVKVGEAPASPVLRRHAWASMPFDWLYCFREKEITRTWRAKQALGCACQLFPEVKEIVGALRNLGVAVADLGIIGSYAFGYRGRDVDLVVDPQRDLERLRTFLVSRSLFGLEDDLWRTTNKAHCLSALGISEQTTATIIRRQWFRKQRLKGGALLSCFIGGVDCYKLHLLTKGDSLEIRGRVCAVVSSFSPPLICTVQVENGQRQVQLLAFSPYFSGSLMVGDQIHAIGQTATTDLGESLLLTSYCHRLEILPSSRTQQDGKNHYE